MFGILLLSLVTYPLHLDLWVDKDDAVYYPTERLKIFFQTEKDCFVAVYNIEPGGRINKLFPQDGVSGWVEAHQVYQLPPKDADYDYVIEGPEGIESIIALASEKRLPALDDKKSDVASRTIEISIKEPDPAKLRILSIPPNCQIYITGLDQDEEYYYGQTPHTLVLRPGEYTVRIKKAGFKTLTRRIWLEPGEKRSVSVELVPGWY